MAIFFVVHPMDASWIRGWYTRTVPEFGAGDKEAAHLNYKMDGESYRLGRGSARKYTSLSRGENQ